MGEEIQWDWLELRETPWGAKAFVLVGVLSHSGRLRCWFSESMDQAHLVAGIHQVLVCLGGTARRWRTDRMSTVVAPGTDRVRASFAAVAKHYGAAVDVCPPRRPRRKGAVEKGIDYLTQSWWRTARRTHVRILSYPVSTLSSHVFQLVFWRPSSSRPRLAAVSAAYFHGTKAADRG